MALVVKSKRTPYLSDPKSSLVAALQDFETILSAEQKLVYKGSYTKPGAQDVVAFVSRIDADNKGRAKRCVAPRLCTFLEGTVQFTAVVDTFVSSSPFIAALVWGSLKTAILTASNVASYFDKITDMIMKIGRNSPTFQQFGLLYSSSIGLQGALCQYYAIIIRLCIKIIQISQRTALMQMLSPVFNPFETDFKPFIVDLDQTVKDIQIQISLASKQAIEEESKLAQLERDRSSAHRKLLQQFSTDTRSELKELRARMVARDAQRTKKELLDQLSTIDHLKGWRQAKSKLLPGTAEWFRQEPDFVSWIDSDVPSVLWCLGILGSGKTTLVANIIAHLMSQRSTSDIVAYHFCHFDEKKSLDVNEIIGSIARQVLDSRIGGLDVEMLRQRLNFAGLLSQNIDWIFSLLECSTCVYILLDGLDECGTEDLLLLFQTLAAFMNGKARSSVNQQSINLKLLCTGRPELESQPVKFIAPNYRLMLRGPILETDICYYISTVLDQCLQDRRLKLRDPSIILKIAEVLYNEANGMFLWAKLLIDEICQQESDLKIIQALASLPKDLAALFRQKLKIIESSIRGSDAIKVLQYCGVARRPLSIAELEELMSLEIGQNFLDYSRFPNDIYSIIEACLGLVYVDEEDFSVHYAHHSVKQHLFESAESFFDKKTAELDLGLSCLTYVNLQNFKGQLARTSPDYGKLVDPIAVSLRAINPVSNKTASIARLLLQKLGSSRQLNTAQLSKQLQDAAGTRDDNTNRDVAQFPFLHYAKTNWLTHLCNLSRDHTYWPQFVKTISVHHDVAEKPWLRDKNDATSTETEWPWSNLNRRVTRFPPEFDLVEAVDTVRSLYPFPLLCWSIKQNIPSAAVAAMELILNIKPRHAVRYKSLGLFMIAIADSCNQNKPFVAHALTRYVLKECIPFKSQRSISIHKLMELVQSESLEHNHDRPFVSHFIWTGSVQPEQVVNKYSWIEIFEASWREWRDDSSLMLLQSCLQMFPTYLHSDFVWSLFQTLAQPDITEVPEQLLLGVLNCDTVLSLGIDRLWVRLARQSWVSSLCDSLVDSEAPDVDLAKLDQRLLGHYFDSLPKFGGLLTLFRGGYKTTSTIVQYFKKSPLLSIDDIPSLRTQCAGAEVYQIWYDCHRLTRLRPSGDSWSEAATQGSIFHNRRYHETRPRLSADTIPLDQQLPPSIFKIEERTSQWVNSSSISVRSEGSLPSLTQGAWRIKAPRTTLIDQRYRSTVEDP